MSRIQCGDFCHDLWRSVLLTQSALKKSSTQWPGRQSQTHWTSTHTNSYTCNCKDILASFTHHPHVVQNLYDCYFTVKHNWSYLAQCAVWTIASCEEQIYMMCSCLWNVLRSVHTKTNIWCIIWCDKYLYLNEWLLLHQFRQSQNVHAINQRFFFSFFFFTEKSLFQCTAKKSGQLISC